MSADLQHETYRLFGSASYYQLQHPGYHTTQGPVDYEPPRTHRIAVRPNTSGSTDQKPGMQDADRFRGHRGPLVGAVTHFKKKSTFIGNGARSLRIRHKFFAFNDYRCEHRQPNAANKNDK